MQEFERIFGRSPRVRMVEAILRLAPNDFTRPEAAREAGLHKPSANRILAALEKDGVIVVVGRRPIRYGVRARITLLEILGLAEASLRLERGGGADRHSSRRLKDALAKRLEERVAPRNEKGAGAAGDGILQLRGLGKEVWKGVDPDRYVDELRGVKERRNPSGRGQP